MEQVNKLSTFCGQGAAELNSREAALELVKNTAARIGWTMKRVSDTHVEFRLNRSESGAFYFLVDFPLEGAAGQLLLQAIEACRYWLKYVSAVGMLRAFNANDDDGNGLVPAKTECERFLRFLPGVQELRWDLSRVLEQIRDAGLA